MTLRELVWAAEARGRGEWARTVSVVQWVVGALTGKEITAGQIAPGVFKAEPEPVKSPELQQIESELAFKVLGEALRRQNRGR